VRAVFADTFYFLALLDRRDPRHAAAIAESRVPGRRFVTTEHVLVELGDALHKPGSREEYAAVVQLVRGDAAWTLVPASAALMQRGLDLYRRHRDKEWQMTDCLSFAAMRQLHLREALTGDHHFEQAGFRALLR
jgi:uncharacterized protein